MLLAIISNYIFVGKIDWMHVSHVFMALCRVSFLSSFWLFWKWNNLLYIFLLSFVLFIILGDIGMSQKLYDECIMTISNYFINCISFFKSHAWMISRECVCLCVDIYVFNFALTSCSCVEENQKWLTISHSQLGILTAYKFKLLK